MILLEETEVPMSRTVGHDYREYYGWKMIQKAKKDRKYGRRDLVNARLRRLVLEKDQEGYRRRAV